MQVYSNATSLIRTVRLVDDAGDPITAVAYNDASLEVAVRAQSAATWTVLTLVDGTLGSYLANSWKADPDGDGLHQLCLPNSVVVAGTATNIRVTYGANPPQYDTVEAVLINPASINVMVTGDHTITVTVLDASTSEPIENARVRIYRTGADGTSETGADGVAVLGRDSATWTVVVSASGYETLVSELVVSDDASVTYQLTPLVVVPGTGELTTGYLTALDDEGQPEDGVVIYCEMTAAPSGDTGFAYDTRQRAETSGLNGLVQFSGLVKGGTYRIWRGVRTPQATLVTIPADAASTYQLPSRIGREVT